MKYTEKYQDKFLVPDECLLETARQFHVLSHEAEGLFIKKNNYYRDGFKKYGISGIIVRLYDKLQALQSSLIDPSSSDEDVTEAFLDLSNYSILGAILNHYEEKNECSQHLYIQPSADVSELFCVVCKSRYDAS